MLRSTQQIIGYKLSAQDGEIGHCHDFVFDDESWIIRYMVADTGNWLPGRKTLLSPRSLGHPDWEAKLFPVNLSRSKIEQSPPISKDAPISRQMESMWHEHYGDVGYWDMPSPAAQAEVISVPPIAKRQADPPHDTHLRSVREVTGYSIRATDGEVGHVEDFIVDDDQWSVRYMIVDTRNWFPGGRKVLVSPQWINEVSWVTRSVVVDLTKNGVQQSPEYDATLPVNREYEARLYDFYGKPTYWSD